MEEVEGHSSEVCGMVFLDISWRSIDNSITPYLLYWDTAFEKVQAQTLSKNEHITWSIQGPNRCTGYRNADGKRMPCPERVILQKGRYRCGPCTAMDYLDNCMKCNGSSCVAPSSRLERCQETKYAVYMVMIGEDVKVGVSNLKRLRTRWIEQGADYGTVVEIIKGGDRARRIESEIGKAKGITKAIRTSRKIGMIHRPVELDIAEKTLKEKLLDLNRIIDINELQIEPLFSCYGFRDLKTNVAPLKFRNQHHDISVVGDVLGIKGSVLLIGIGGLIQALNLKELRGLTILDNPDASVVAQSGLGEFL
jgi:hypothetical protein